MLYQSQVLESNAIMTVAELMCAAARTAPKTRGKDNIVTLVLTGEDIVRLSEKLKQMALRETGQQKAHFIRDAINLCQAQAVVMIGVKRVWCGMPYCSMCGFPNCEACRAANANCVFPPIDLGVALGSAVAVAADMRVDNRIMFSAGKAAEEMGYPGGEDIIWQGIPLSIAGKNVFFDRKIKV